MAEIFVESLYEAVVDCLKVVPILFLAYLLVAYLSHDHSHKFSSFLSKHKKSSVFFASFLGCIPQCGFSSVMADLYSQRKISLGALVAVFIATSDEAIPIMLTNSDSIVDMLILIIVKIVLAIFWGYLIEVFVQLFSNKKKFVKQGAKTLKQDENSSLNEHDGLHEHLHQDEKTLMLEHTHNESVSEHLHEDLNEHSHEFLDERSSEHSHEFLDERSSEHLGEHSHEYFGEITSSEDVFHDHHHECGHIHTDSCKSSCGHSHGNCCGDNIFIDAFDHTFNIAIYIFVATFIINLIVGYCGLDALSNLLTDNVYIQIIIASLIGLIPNCASSVLLVELNVLYGTLSFPALVAGLTAGAGVGLVILFTKNKKHPLHNVGIVVMQYFIAVVSGLALSLIF